MKDSVGSVDGISTLTNSTFGGLVLRGAGPIAVEFMSYSCAHCAAMEPVLQQAAEIIKAKEKIFRVNIAVDEDLAQSFEIQGTPTLVMFLNGSEIGRVEGPDPTISNILAELTRPFES